jgi:hypothetical protein
MQDANSGFETLLERTDIALWQIPYGRESQQVGENISLSLKLWPTTLGRLGQVFSKLTFSHGQFI